MRISDHALQDPALSHLRLQYARSNLAQGIVHMSLGGFHRAHEALYIHELMADHAERAWAICGVGLLRQDAAMRDALVPQDCLYTLMEKSPAGVRERLIGSITQYLYAPEDPGAVLSKLCEPGIRIVSLTVTENGYFFNHGTGEFDEGLADIQHDLQSPAVPRTMLGFLVEGLKQRRDAGHRPFTVLSCDNFPGNGTVARKVVLAFAKLRDPTLAEWISQNVAFPNSMVDRITPITTDADRAFVAATYGYEDRWPVTCEPFRQWVIEDTFPSGRPPWEKVGVQMTTDVRPYETMKLRLLNASHFALAYLGYLAGYTFVHEVIHDQVFQDFIRRMMSREVTPHLAPPPGIELGAYERQLVERFGNQHIKDQLARICQDGSSKAPKFVLPSIRSAVERGGSVKLLSLAIAGWLRYLAGVDEKGRPIAIDDPMASELRERAEKGRDDPRPVLALSKIFGGDLPRNAAFIDEVSGALHAVYTKGSRAAVAERLG